MGKGESGQQHKNEEQISESKRRNTNRYHHQVSIGESYLFHKSKYV